MPRRISDAQLKRLLYPDGRARDIYRKVSFPIVKAILPLNISPDFIHLLRLFSCVAGTALLCTGDRVLAVLGALLFQLNILLDTFDGALARHQGKASVKGEYQDVALDHLTSSFLYFVAAAGFAYAQEGVLLFVWVGLGTSILAQVAAFLRAMYVEYGVTSASASRLVRFAHQDNSRLIALILLIAAVLDLPFIAVAIFLTGVMIKILVLFFDLRVRSGRNPLNAQMFVRYIALVIVVFLALLQAILGIRIKKLRRRLLRGKFRSALEKSVVSRFG